MQRAVPFILATALALLVSGCYSGGVMTAPLPAESHPGLHALAAAQPLDGSRQLVLVTAPGWDATHGELRVYQRDADFGPWSQVFAAPCSLGTNGLAWGRGLHHAAPAWGPVKSESDGRAVAGAFMLLQSFGPASLARGAGVPVLDTALQELCVTDTQSPLYNTLLHASPNPMSNWDSDLALGKDVHSGLIVGQNLTPAQINAGSCVLLHAPESDVALAQGGVAVDQETLGKLVTTLQSAASPVLVQLPQEEYELLKDPWGLP